MIHALHITTNTRRVPKKDWRPVCWSPTDPLPLVRYWPPPKNLLTSSMKLRDVFLRLAEQSDKVQFHCTVLNILWRHLLSIRVQTHEKLYAIFFFTTILNRQAGRALKFEGKCGVKQTKKRAMLFRVTFENTSAIINNFSQHLIGLFCLQTKGSVFICHKNDRWLTLSTLEWLMNKLTDWMNDQN